MKYRNRKIVAVEGIDGAGKTTIIKEVSNYFGDDVIFYSRTKKGKFIDKLVSSTVRLREIIMGWHRI